MGSGPLGVITKIGINFITLVSLFQTYMSLTTPHPIWTTAGSSPANVAMATVQAVMVSGRYRTEALCSHWSQNRKGMCLLSKDCNDVLEDLTHILQICPGLSRFRQNLNKFTQEYSEKLENPDIQVVLLEHCNVSHPLFKDFLLDCSSLPPSYCVCAATSDMVMMSFTTYSE